MGAMASNESTGSPVFFAPSDIDFDQVSQAARETFPFFWRELSWEFRRILPAYNLKIVKATFVEGDVVEHMWLEEIDFDGATIRGHLLNTANELPGLQQGDMVAVDFERVCDWMLTNERGVLGGFTVQAIRRAMSPKERKEHDEAWGLPFYPPDRVRLPSQDDDHPMALNMEESLEEFLRQDPSRADAVDEEGFSMLHREALAGNANIVATLLRHGARKDRKTTSGQSARDLAMKMRWRKVIEVLDAAT